MTPQALVVMAGLQGVGKSTIATHLARELPAVLLSVDPIEGALHRADFLPSFAAGMAAYLVAEEVAATNLQLGKTVVVDAANYKQVARDTWTGLARVHGVRLLFVDVVCSDLQAHKARVEARHRGIPGMAEVTFDDVVERYAETDGWGEEPRIMVDNAGDPDLGGVLTRVRAAIT